MFLPSGSQEDVLLVHHSSFSFSSPVDLPQAFGVDHILILIQMLSHAGASHNCSPISILIRSAQDISEIRVSTLLSFQLLRGCYLIQAI